MSQSTDLENALLLKCTVISCPNCLDTQLDSRGNPCTFYPFPSNRAIAKVWKEKCGVAADHEIATAKVCSDHFKSSDFTDPSRKSLKSDALPRDNLGWMFGMPEVKPLLALKADEVQEAVDTNERLLRKLQQLEKEAKPLREKYQLYQKKLCTVNAEIMRLEGLISRLPVKKSRGGKVEGSSLICKVFSPAQINMLQGKKKVVWSYDDLAMAFTLRHIGNKECYLYLKNTLNMPLPALSCVQRWVASNKP